MMIMMDGPLGVIMPGGELDFDVGGLDLKSFFHVGLGLYLISFF